MTLANMRGALAVLITGIAFAASAVAKDKQASPQTLLTNVNVFDGKSEKLAMGQDVLVEGNLIKLVGKGLKAGDGATVINGGGRTLMPGLIDMHSHLATGEGLTEGRDDLDAYAIGAIAGRNLVTLLEQGFTTTRGGGGLVRTPGLAPAFRQSTRAP